MSKTLVATTVSLAGWLPLLSPNAPLTSMPHQPVLTCPGSVVRRTPPGRWERGDSSRWPLLSREFAFSRVHRLERCFPRAVSAGVDGLMWRVLRGRARAGVGCAAGGKAGVGEQAGRAQTGYRLPAEADLAWRAACLKRRFVDGCAALLPNCTVRPP
jgi:hypothetical protein